MKPISCSVVSHSATKQYALGQSVPNPRSFNGVGLIFSRIASASCSSIVRVVSGFSSLIRRPSFIQERKPPCIKYGLCYVKLQALNLLWSISLTTIEKRVL
nr:hypothetical protein Iba_scaffold23333CG0010 [Ipomoea batatas]